MVGWGQGFVRDKMMRGRGIQGGGFAAVGRAEITFFGWLSEPPNSAMVARHLP